MLEGRRIEIHGAAHGDRLMPWVVRVAEESRIRGRLRDGGSIVTIDAFGSHLELDRFVERLWNATPASARVKDLVWESIPAEPVSDFQIVDAGQGAESLLSIAPDLAMCEECERELLNPTSRRYRYPFTSCTSCGPRYALMKAAPLERATTSMSSFQPCADCRAERDTPGSRRFQDELISCPACGPRLAAFTPQRTQIGNGDAIAVAARALRAQLTVAMKGIGGYQLICDATSGVSVARLRERKHHDERPFAVMVRDLQMAERCAVLGDAERALLASPERPIVLAPRRDGSPVAAEVSPESGLLGLILPWSAMHHLLLAEIDRPVVVSSGNESDRPMIFNDRDALRALGGIADLFLMHALDPVTRSDDSLTRVVGGQPLVLRRGRGYAPTPFALRRSFSHSILALGSDARNAFCLTSSNLAYLGPHVGEIAGDESLADFQESVEHFERILQLEPLVIAHDLDPEARTTKWARARKGVTTIAVQHHHAHVASCMAENDLSGRVLGVACDGGGYGADGTIWGGELLLADACSVERIACVMPLLLPHEPVALRQVWRLALSLLDAVFDGEPPLHAIPLFRHMPRRAVDAARRWHREHHDLRPTSALARYFDAIGAAILGLPDARFDGDVAQQWNLAGDDSVGGYYPFDIHEAARPWEIDLRMVVKAAIEELIDGRPAAVISAKFHNTVSIAISEVVRMACERLGRHPVVLTGGCFQNPLLADRVRASVGAFTRVYSHHQVPPTNGGLALGQAVVADALIRQHQKSNLAAARTLFAEEAGVADRS